MELFYNKYKFMATDMLKLIAQLTSAIRIGMFRLLEKFTNNADVWGKFKRDETPIATTTLVPSTSQQLADINNIATGLTSSANINVQSSMNKYADSLKQLNVMNTRCTGANTIEDVIALNESGGSIQCGWYYNKGTGSIPQTNQGYLSTKQGPVIGLSSLPPQQPYTFYYGNTLGANRFFSPSSTRSLQAGQETIDRDKCNLTTCEAIVGKTGCAYCKEGIIQGIPVDVNGKPKYASLTCSGNGNLVTTCPSPITSGPSIGSTNTETRNSQANPTTSLIRPVPIPPISACSPDTNKRFSGACLQSVLRDNGCGTQGSLSLALNGFTSSSLANSIEINNPNIKTYMEGNTAFSLTNFLTASTLKDAETEAKALANASKTAVNDAQTNPLRQNKKNTLAIDLCTQSGYFLDNYNFCMELNGDSPIPTGGWDLTCLQQAWKDAKLKPQGSAYPSIYNLKDYNKLSPWSSVKQRMKTIYDNIYNGGPLIETFVSKHRVYVSPPFMLQSKNYPTHYLTYMGSGLQLRMEPKMSDSIKQLFVWREGDINGSISIFPATNDSDVLRHKSWSLISFPKNQNDAYLKESSTFYVRPGKADSNMISLQATYVAGMNDPSPFYLRHTQYALILDDMNRSYNRNNSALFNNDSTFQPLDSNSNPLLTSFFTKPSITSSSINQVSETYPGQHQSAMLGWGIKLDTPRIAPTDSGMEIYECKYRQRGIYIITKYSVATSYPSVSSNRIDALFTLTNYSVDTTKTVTPTLKLGPGDVGAIAVNSYLTGWGWQSGQPIDAAPNTFESINHIKAYKLNTKNGRYPGRAEGYNQPYGAFELKGGDIPNIVKTQWWNGGRGGQFDYTLNPSAKPYIVRNPYAPFLRFEPVGKGFGEVRFGDMANNPYNMNIEVGASISYNTSDTDKLANPGSNGYITLSDHIYINYVDAATWNIATLIFSVNFDSIIQKPQTILFVGNAYQPDPRRFWEVGESTGFRCVAMPSSSTSSYPFVVQSITQNGNVKATSDPITLTKTSWYMAVINKFNGQVEIYELTASGGTYKTSTTPKGSLVIPEYTLKPFTDNNSLPRIRIGAAISLMTIRLKVAFLHLFDNTITEIDPTTELTGYASGGYESGVF